MKNEKHLPTTTKGLLHFAQQEFTLDKGDTPTVYFLMGRILELEDALSIRQDFKKKIDLLLEFEKKVNSVLTAQEKK